ncbi:MAG: hypothetical protein HQK77_14745 [Desulfobacterales bacterium]|nr:hypothetical protein [Desulfobacterales bacterium]
MSKTTFSQNDPLRNPIDELHTVFPTSGFGTVLARAGVGKTGILVHLALDYLAQGHHVLHMSLSDTIDKINLWYKEIFHHRVNTLSYLNDIEKRSFWDHLQSYRFIMSFLADDFRWDKIIDSISDLKKQAIFSPKILIIDGIQFDASSREGLVNIKKYADEHQIFVWFSIRTHRHEEFNANGYPVRITPILDMFDACITLKPENDIVHIDFAKWPSATPIILPKLCFNPATMFISTSGNP